MLCGTGTTDDSKQSVLLFYDAVWLHIVPLYTIPGIKRASLHLSNGFYMGYQTGQLIGLKSAVAHVASNLHQQVRQQYQAIQRQSLTQEERNDQVERILGGVPDGQSMAGLASGFARLSGLDTPIARLEEKIPHLFDSVRNLEYCKLQCIRIWQFYVPSSFRLRIL
jgi:hypothetical protein